MVDVSRAELQALESQRLERERDATESLAELRERVSKLEGSQTAGRIWIGVAVSLFGIVMTASTFIIVNLLREIANLLS